MVPTPVSTAIGTMEPALWYELMVRIRAEERNRDVAYRRLVREAEGSTKVGGFLRAFLVLLLVLLLWLLIMSSVLWLRVAAVASAINDPIVIHRATDRDAREAGKLLMSQHFSTPDNQQGGLVGDGGPGYEGRAAVILAILIFGTPVLLAELLRRRRRRERLTQEQVLVLLDGRETRGMVSVQVYSPPLSRRTVITLYTMYCSYSLLWNVIVHALQSLPPSAQVIIECPHVSHRWLTVRAPHLLTVRRIVSESEPKTLESRPQRAPFPDKALPAV